MISCLKVKKFEDNNETLFIKNGGVLLEELVAFSNGRSNPIRHFSAKELLRATNNYDRHQIVVEDGGYQLYKGSLEDLPVLVKKYENDTSIFSRHLQRYCHRITNEFSQECFKGFRMLLGDPKTDCSI